MENNFMPKERRRAQRFGPSLIIFYKDKNGKGWAKAICKDLSGGGIRLVTESRLECGNTIRIKILAEENKNIFLSAKIIWSRKGKGKTYEAGANFLKIGKHDDFTEFICNQLMEFFNLNAGKNEKKKNSEI